MASIPSLFLLFVKLLAYQVTAQKNHSNVIKLGSHLSPNANSTSWFSASGLFAFGFYQQGNGFAIGISLIGIPNNTIVWTANRSMSPVSSDSSLELTKSGLLLHSENGNQDLLTGLAAASASMLDSGNFVLYGENSDVLWQSFDHPTDTILGNQNLSSGQRLVSGMSKSDHSNGHFTLIMQGDGNLVAYPVNTSQDAYWSTDTFGTSFIQLGLNLEGFLCLQTYVNSCSLVLANSPYLGENTTIVYRATLDDDGIFRLYEHQIEKNISVKQTAVWSSMSSQCDVKGFCGLNSYCSTISGECQCYPGFLPRRQSNMFLECELNYSKDICETSADRVLLFNVTYLQGISLGDSPYYDTPMEEKDCVKSFQEDCNCGAVLYDELNDRRCRKYKLPLRYGRISNDSATKAFFKLPSENSNTPNITNPFQEKKPEVLVDNKKNLILIIVLSLGLISFLGLVSAMSLFFIYRHQVHTYTRLSASVNLGFTEDCSVRTFSYHELVNSTGSFTEEIGRGSFGAVYRGTIHGTNRRVAVKKLDKVVDEGEREFQAEITAIAQTHHRNLVQLIGFCIDGSRKLLVYEYMSNGSLADVLFKAEMRLSWKQRVKIALDVARGILYLHEECEVRIVHCNIKPRNILLDEAWTAKISDFGLARLLNPEHSRTRTGNEVISGYLAPEWQKEASISVKSDIYSYGVVLLEIICCRSNIDVNVSSAEEILLSSWVYNCFVRGELNNLVADEDVEWKTLERMVKVGLWCVQDNPTLRPSMKNVILMLEGLKDIPIPPSPVLLV